MRMAFGNLRVSRKAFANWCIVVNSFIVIVDGDREHLLGMILPDDVVI